MAERIALVTGCSSGFGAAVVRTLAGRGWTVIAGSRDPDRLPAALGHARAVRLDVTRQADIEAVAQSIRNEHGGRLDCLVNNAGYALTGPFATYSVEQMRRQFDVNVIGPARLTQALLPALRCARGRVINISSLAGESGLPLSAMYCASKHALEGWTESLRHEWAQHGVQVALVEPGGHRTRFVPNMEWGDHPPPEDSIEARQLAGYRAMQARLLARPGQDPQAVANAVVRLAECARMPLRTRVGSDAKLMRALRRWLPERMVIALTGAAFRRQLGKVRG